MANSSLNLTSLDFDTLKEQFKTFLKSQSVFKDYNFDGSNINVLLDVMSYNTYLNAFYLNMVASEMFLDSAQKLDTVVSHAKELNYTPRSHSSAFANVTITLSADSTLSPFTVPKNTIFVGTNSNGTYNFVTRDESTYTTSNSTITINNLQVFEGNYVNNSFIVDYSNEAQRFVLTNDNIDLDSLVITVYENNQQDSAEYNRVDTLFGLNSQSNVYFVQAAQNNQYEILFGDGFLGKKPQNEALIVAEYILCSGSDASGVYELSMGTDLGPINGGLVSVDSIIVNANSSGGSNSENIESIRFYAPRYFATQLRAVSSDDYSSIILSKFGDVIEDVNVYGGELLEPKQYGIVVICLKPVSGLIAPDYLKHQISSYMNDFISLPTRVEITDPDYFHLNITSTVQYNKNSTSKYASDINSIILQAIMSYSEENLESFNEDFRYSKFISAIDNSDESITSNNTEVRLIKKLYPKSNYPTSYTISFNNESHDNTHGHSVIESSYFTYVAEDGTNYQLSKIEDDGEGILYVYTYINNILTVLNSSIGTINYETGFVTINNLNIANYTGDSLSIYLYVKEKDIIINNSQILLIDAYNVNITVTEESN